MEELIAELDRMWRALSKNLDEQMQECLVRLSRSLGVEPPPAPRTPQMPDGADPYTVLGLKRYDPEFLVRKRYRELLMKLHPDTSGLGAASEHLFKEVQAAYEKICRERGWR